MGHSTQRDMNIHLVPESITFSLFTTEQIKKLCVTKISTPLMLDALGHPLLGGLYDHRLGPMSDRGDPCGTCRKSFTNCPGHFGYIELPLPVVNPLFHKIIGTLLRTSCLSCYQIQIPVHVKRCLCIQIKLLSAGLVTEALEVERTMTELISQYRSYDNIPAESITSIVAYEVLAKKTLDELGSTSVLNQNTETLHNQFVSTIFKEFKTRKSCMYCKQPINKIQVLKNLIIMSMHKIDSESPRGSKAVMAQKIKGYESKYVTPTESRQYLRELWLAEREFVQEIVSVLKGIDAEHPTDVLYFDVLPVPPPNTRPINLVLGSIIEHKQSMPYKKILEDSMVLKLIIMVVQKKGDVNILTSKEAKDAYNTARGKTAIEKLKNAWEELQYTVNGLVDRESHRNTEGQGLKQIIEKKTGIVRMNMMGKRVNFSARSVITPDPNLDIDEIGVPEEFAKKLTYPVPVTAWNVEQIRTMIKNGPNVHPGAVWLEVNGVLTRIDPNNPDQKESLLKRLLTLDDRDNAVVKIVHRHLCNGDMLLLNRQPTLHKPSIMAHKARILKGEKTLRLHYANCKAYNADFDGDEMNVHFPQNELAKSEAANIVNVANQYLVPKDGTPLSGLIQDHMIASVKLSMRGRFFNRIDYHQLVFQGLSFKQTDIITLPPAIMRPRRLWSGKQIISTIIINIIPKGKALINLAGTSKIPAKAWESQRPRDWMAGGTPFANPNTMSETEVVIRDGELLVGILDKSHYGATPYGLIHCIYELYGGTYATRILSSLTKVFMYFLQREGFTLSVRDILTVKKADAKRKKIIKKSREIGIGVVTSALDIPNDTPLDEIVAKIEEASATNPKTRASIDRAYKSALDSYTNKINKACLPAGLVCKFPENNLQLMVLSGAKGSTVNTMQISCLLGQIELEGKRPPVMMSGNSLPSFPASEFAPRAGGFIEGRFMTGIKPQEFFFHCMAGREGLIDTAVKTSRSGYLQRCLIKHLEGLHVAYDNTVRNSDNSVIQFRYGEDGMDVTKAQFFNEKQLNFLKENRKAIVDEDLMKQLLNGEDQAAIKQHEKDIREWREKFGDPLQKRRISPYNVFVQRVKDRSGGTKHKPKFLKKLYIDLHEDLRNACNEQCVPCPDPLASTFQPASHFGAINERLEGMLDNFPVNRKKKKFQNMMKLKYMQSMCEPGEPVGLLAAQSIGEPSTQMTLNTFHFAGRGDMNVTLGIPRLREILMMASKNIKTPSMEIPFLNVPELAEKAETLKKMLTKVVVADVLEKIDVTMDLQLEPVRQHMYTLKFYFLRKKYYRRKYCVRPGMILQHMKKKFFSDMFAAIKKFCKINSYVITMEDSRPRKKASSGNDEEEEREEQEKQNPPGDQSSSEDEVEDEEDAKATNKFKQSHEDQEPENEEKEASDEESEAENEEDQNQNQESDPTVMSKEYNTVVDSHVFAQNYTEDKKKHLWCELTFALPLTFKKLDLRTLLREVTSKSVLWETPQIKRAITYMKDDRFMLKTEGINIMEMFKYDKLLDLQKLYCNDVHKIAETYGIEAALKVIVKEVKDVFNVYGIKVDPRHLSLIADYMTYNGTYEPLSRKGMESSVSPMQQISFESSLTFLKNAVIRGKQDTLQNPSSSLMIGKPCSTGTGSFTLLTSPASLSNSG